jgi:nucleoside-diphosphate-sugar epimerase
LNILIIGGTRFMGPVVVKALVEFGHSVTVFHRGETECTLPDSVRQLNGDRDELGRFNSEFESFQPDLILDMILLTKKQARLLVDVMTGISKRLVVISSADVYGNYGRLRGDLAETYIDGKLSESSPLRKNKYPYRNQAKVENDFRYWYDKTLVEQAITSQNELPSTILRLPIVYGPNDPQHRFRDYVRRMIDKRPAILLDEQKADWRITRGYRDNCAAAIVAAVRNEKASSQVFNAGEKSALTERQWIEKIAKIIGWKGKIVTLPNDELPEHLQSPLNWKCHLETDTSRLRTELGFIDPVDFDAGLYTTIDWEKKTLEPDDKTASYYEAEDNVLS